MFSLPNAPLATCSSLEPYHVHYSPSHWSPLFLSFSLSFRQRRLLLPSAPSLLTQSPRILHVLSYSIPATRPLCTNLIPASHLDTCFHRHVSSHPLLFITLFIPCLSTFQTNRDLPTFFRVFNKRKKEKKEKKKTMERRGGCCIARYGGDTDAAWRVGRIMLKYRPIAPKPAAMAPAVPGSADLKSTPCSGKLKRKAPAGTAPGTRLGSKRGRKPKKANTIPNQTEERDEKCSSPSSSTTTTTTSVDSSSLITLPLMPESPEVKPVPSASPANEAVAAVVVPTPVRPVGSWMTVEGLTDIWRQEVPAMPGITSDEAPALISDGWGRVTWANGAYKNLVTGGGEEGEEEVKVGLVTRGLVPAWGTCGGFTCRVRVRYACRKKGKVSLAAPCDVWRLDGGAYAWRLDIKAALSLSLSL